MTNKEAFEAWMKTHEFNTALNPYEETWQAAIEWAASPQEPVAWVRHGDELAMNHGCWTDDRAIDKEWLPLYLHPAPIPAGWKLVPIEPTPNMIFAMTNAGYGEVYSAMLAAAPEYKE